ncbi:hypothetical protein BKA66DRAFT_553302 [Pyrenochaeta sp. MPI-SDFR-AT-0127]|nr:hypothetical protein BKA66DRAFT_553302 [Pyrenochaeta sp. MPI-SDFR-AT-0127]
MFALLILLITTLVPLSASSCFYPNGTEATDQPYAKRYSSDPSKPLYSVCCHTEWANPPGNNIIYGSTADECMPNGLCRNRGKSTKPGDLRDPWTDYWRVYCANEDWSGCLNVCTSGAGAGAGAQLTPCGDPSTTEKWCCGMSTDCCNSTDTSNLVIIPPELGNLTSKSSVVTSSITSRSASTLIPSSSAAASSTSSPASVSSSPPTSSPINSETGGLSHGTVVGLATGLPVGFLLLAIVVAVCWYRKRKRRNKYDGEKIRPVDSRSIGHGSVEARAEERDDESETRHYRTMDWAHAGPGLSEERLVDI